jgi:hypothetical protein
MIRLVTLAALAALVAAPASAQSITVPTAGKTYNQVRKDIATAARQLCREELFGAATISAVEICVRQTVADTLADPRNVSLSALMSVELAQR